MRNDPPLYPLPLVLLLAFLFSGCTSITVQVAHTEKMATETTQLQESKLLDVGILLFDKGKLTEKQMKKEGVQEEIRQAEARYMAYHLKETLQRANSWGAVRVLPENAHTADVVVAGTIVSSNGEELIIKIKVTDSSGARWYEKTYKTYADDAIYQHVPPGTDVYQPVYNRVANDIREHREKLSTRQLMALHNISELRYAASLSPEPFADYIHSGSNGKTSIARLPAMDDPMLHRVRKVRDREFLFIDTLNEHYANFYLEMQEPYENWRKYYLLEAAQRREIERRANRTKLVGALIMVVGATSHADIFTAGAWLYTTGVDLSAEAAIHNEAIRELGDSLSAEVDPRVIELQGRTLELTGSLEEQYQKWRKLLREIYVHETGFGDEGYGSDQSSVQL